MRRDKTTDCEACFWRDCDCACRTCENVRAARRFAAEARRIGVSEMVIGETIRRPMPGSFVNTPRIRL